jgi:hypothetical protein
MTDDEMNDALVRVSEFARDIGLHGVMILSPRCPKCGNCHEFAMTADAVQVDDADQSVRALLLRFADTATANTPVLLGLKALRTRQ